jgi:hypothetical protein
MRNGLLAALTVLLAGHGLAFAQPSGALAADPSPRPAASTTITDSLPPSQFLPDDAVIPDDVGTQSKSFGLWGSGEYLLWWFKRGQVPPLATAGDKGLLGSPGTQVLVDNLNFDDDLRQGGRFTVGYEFAAIPMIGIEANYFFLSDGQSDVAFSSTGAPVLAQPFVNVATGKPDANLVAFPGVAVGSIIVGTQNWLWGTEANLTAGVFRADRFHLSALGGFRFLRFEDTVTTGEQFLVAPSVPGFGGSKVNLKDEFRTVNCFYGGQVGLESGVRLDRLTIDFRGKLGLGQMQQAADVGGTTHVLRPDGSTTIFQGGLYALQSNSGRHLREELAFIPEVGLNVGLQVTRYLKVYTGYSFLWVSTVARAGEQIDPVINVSQFPIRSGAGPLVGSARPAFNFNETDFWAQGLNFGLELRY